jgi:hypothetical protein
MINLLTGVADFVCECGEQFESGRPAVTHAKQNLHRVRGLYFSQRMEVEEHFHACGICTHVTQRVDGGFKTVCIANNPVAIKEQT